MLLPVASGQRFQELPQFFLGEAGQREIEVLEGLEVGQQTGEQLSVLFAADLVEREIE